MFLSSQSQVPEWKITLLSSLAIFYRMKIWPLKKYLGVNIPVFSFSSALGWIFGQVSELWSFNPLLSGLVAELEGRLDPHCCFCLFVILSPVNSPLWLQSTFNLHSQHLTSLDEIRNGKQVWGLYAHMIIDVCRLDVWFWFIYKLILVF